MADSQTDFHNADAQRREPLYEPDVTVRFPASAGLDNSHVEADGERASALQAAMPHDRQMGDTLFTAQATLNTLVAFRIVSSVPGGESHGGVRKSVSLFNNGPTTMFVSGREDYCTPGLGYPIPAATGFTFDKEPWGEFWVCYAAAAATNDVRAMVEIGYGSTL